MAVFKRRRSTEDSSDAPELGGTDAAEVESDLVDDEVSDDVDEFEDFDDDEGDGAEVADDTAGLAGRENGPFDVTETDDDAEPGTYLDLGALRITPSDGVEVRIELDEASGVVQAVTLVSGETQMQVGAFAAPRTEGIWEEVRTEIAASITNSGGTVDILDGELGPELKVNLNGEDDKGRRVSQPARFVGVDGPRWFLRGLISGERVNDEATRQVLMDSFRSIVVVRGTDPMAPHEALPIALPREVTDADEDPEAAGHDLNPFRRGPEITEIR